MSDEDKLTEGRHYFKEIPEPDIHYPDDDPFILELKRKYPGTVWDRYIPSELAMERWSKAKQQKGRVR